MSTTFLPIPVFSLSDADSLASTDLTSCTLLMNVGIDQLSYAIYDPGKEALIYLKGYYFDQKREKEQHILGVLEKCFDADKILFTAFRQIKISLDTPSFTIVPASLYTKDLKKAYFSMLMPVMEGQTIHKDVIADRDMINVYAANKNIIGYLQKEFGKAQYYHAETAFLQYVLQGDKDNGKRIFVRITSECIILNIISGNQLLLAQTYFITHGKDTLYFILNAMRQFGFSNDEVRLYLSGEIEETTALYKELRFEIPQTAWLSRPKNLHYIPAFDEYPGHYFYLLTALASCE